MTVYRDFNAATDVGPLITKQVNTMQQVQATLYRGLSAWRTGRLMSYAFPVLALPTLASYDWEEAVKAWNSSVNTWWGAPMTSLVAARPYERGADGKTRVEAWLKMGEGLIAWAERIGTSMRDDSFLARVRDFGLAFKNTARSFLSTAVGVVGEPLQKVGWTLLGIAVPIALGIFILGRAGFTLDTGPVKIGRR